MGDEAATAAGAPVSVAIRNGDSVGIIRPTITPAPPKTAKKKESTREEKNKKAATEQAAVKVYWKKKIAATTLQKEVTGADVAS